jgi:hypothetical protein
MVEVINKGSFRESRRAPLLFAHGGQHAAWCWDEHFLDFLAADGYRAIALSLRGHGTSANSNPPPACSIADYVEGVRSVADQLPQAPVVVGHGLGGFVMHEIAGVARRRLTTPPDLWN